MAIGGSCERCKYWNPGETNGSKCYCEWYKTYYYPSEGLDCRHWVYIND